MRVYIARAWQTACQPGTESGAERKTLVLLSLHFCTQNPACSNVSEEPGYEPAWCFGVLANTNGEKLKWLVRPPVGTFIYFIVCLIVSHLYVIPEAVLVHDPHWGQLRGKVALLSRQRHKAQYLALLSSTSECVHIFMGTISKIWKC